MNNSLYDERGVIKYITPNLLISKLATNIIEKYGFPCHENNELIRDLMNLSAGVMQSYDIAISLNGLGGSGLKNFYSQGDKIELSIKEILKDMLDKNIYYKYLSQIVLFDAYPMIILAHYDME